MDTLRICLIVTLCLTLVAHVVLSAPTSNSGTEQGEEFLSEYEPDMELFRDRRSVEVPVVPEDEDDMLTRLRRQSASMASSRIFRTRNRDHSYGRSRLRGLRRYHERIRQNNRKGRVVDW